MKTMNALHQISRKRIPLQMAHSRVSYIDRCKTTSMKKLTIIAAVILATGATSVRAADVKENYEKHCTKCHGADGKAQTKMGIKAGAKDFTDPKVQAEITEEKAFKAIKEGIKEGEKTKMKPAEELSDAEMKALAQFVKTFK